MTSFCLSALRLPLDQVIKCQALHRERFGDGQILPLEQFVRRSVTDSCHRVYAFIKRDDTMSFSDILYFVFI